MVTSVFWKDHSGGSKEDGLQERILEASRQVTRLQQ